MKQAENTTGTEPGNSAAGNVALRQLDPVLIKFVETLAIADAKARSFSIEWPRVEANPRRSEHTGRIIDK